MTVVFRLLRARFGLKGFQYSIVLRMVTPKKWRGVASPGSMSFTTNRSNCDVTTLHVQSLAQGERAPEKQRYASGERLQRHETYSSFLCLVFREGLFRVIELFWFTSDRKARSRVQTKGQCHCSNGARAFTYRVSIGTRFLAEFHKLRFLFP